MAHIIEDTVHLSFMLFFVISGLVVNLIQAIFFVLIRPLSKNIYRRINGVVAELLWLEVVWLVEWGAGLEIQVHTDNDPKTMTGVMGRENAIVVSNYGNDINFIPVLAQRSGCLCSSLFSVNSKFTKFLPVIGWAMWFSENIFMESNYWGPNQDKASAYISGLRGLKNFPRPIWMTLRSEETGGGGMRSEAFVSVVKHMRSFVPAVYDVTIAFPEARSDSPQTLLQLFYERLRRRKSYVVHVHVKRHEIRGLPRKHGALEKWCEDVLEAKQALLDQHRADQTFGDQVQVLETCSGKRRPLKPLLVVTSWALVFVFSAIKFPLLSLLVLLIASSGLTSVLSRGRLSSLLLNLTAFLLRRAFGSQVASLLLISASYYIYFLLRRAFCFGFRISCCSYLKSLSINFGILNVCAPRS